jgi:CRISPR-associated endonuclease Cas3-HD
MAEQLSSLEAFPARPDQSLADHLTGVLENTRNLVSDGETTAYGDDWLTVLEVIALTHDAGKLTTWFGQYLETGDRGTAPRIEHTYHGFLSALLSAHTLYSLDVSEAARNAGFCAVAKHHSVVPTLEAMPSEYVQRNKPAVDTRYEIARDQLQNIDANAPEAADDLLQAASNGALSWDDIFVDEPSHYRDLLKNLGTFDDRFYGTVLRAWSTLVCADKLDAASAPTPDPSPRRPSLPAFRERIEQLPDGSTPIAQQMNGLRSAAHETAWQRLLDQFEAGDRLFNIALPTGFGKTLTGLRAALELAEEHDRRVIYALPYTSIIDQVDSVCREQLDVLPGDPEYTIHHHLADTWTDLSELTGEPVNDGSDSLYAETWQSGLVLTTFTQLFESAAGPGNTQSMKLPALEESVIIVDEPQAVPHRWWGLVGRLSEHLIDEYDAALVQMTATQPRFLEQNQRLPSPVSLTGQYDECLAFLESHSRVEFELHESLLKHLDGKSESTITIADAAAELWMATPQGSTTLAIVNTIESAATLTEALTDEEGGENETVRLADELCRFWQTHPEAGDSDDLESTAATYLQFLAEAVDGPVETVVAALTTRIRPHDRGVLLAALRQILNSDRDTPFDDAATITVSTQLIEAGVDVSFDRLYRDFAPLPSLVQAAGRCNREFDGTTGTVTAWRLAGSEDTNRTPSELIYRQQSLLRPTRTAIDSLRETTDQHRLSEARVISEGVEKYYDALHEQRRTATRRDDLAAAFDRGDGDRLRKASLIDQQYETRDVLVLVTDHDVSEYERYERLREQDAWQAAENTFDSLKSRLVTLPVSGDGTGDDEAVTAVDVSGSLERYQIETGRGISKGATGFQTEW